MGDLTANLSTKEFACKCSYEDCNGKLVAHMPLVLAIQGACDHFAAKYNTAVMVSITGPNRCPKHNTDEGGAPGSTHQDYIAADHKIYVLINGSWSQVDSQEQYDYYDKKYFDCYGLGLYSNRVHIDTRQQRARWDAR